MANTRADIYEHNNERRAFVDSDFVRGGARTVQYRSDMYNLYLHHDQLKNYVTQFYVVQEKTFYLLINIDDNNGTTFNQGAFIKLSSAQETPEGAPGTGVSNLMVDITWGELVALKTSKELIPGLQYKIIDYAYLGATGLTSANIPFALIVKAAGNDTVSDDAIACRIASSPNYKFENWEVKYKLSELEGFDFIDQNKAYTAVQPLVSHSFNTTTVSSASSGTHLITILENGTYTVRTSTSENPSLQTFPAGKRTHVKFLNNLFYALGDNTSSYFTSLNGANWAATTIKDINNTSIKTDWSTAAMLAGKLHLFVKNSFTYYVQNGGQFTQFSLGTVAQPGVADTCNIIDKLYILPKIGNVIYILNAANVKTVITLSVPPTSTWNTITYANGNIYLAGSTSVVYNIATGITTPIPVSGELNYVTQLSNLLVAISETTLTTILGANIQKQLGDFTANVSLLTLNGSSVLTTKSTLYDLTLDSTYTNAKGVIYYLKDEFDNEASYDFKNILSNGAYTFDTIIGGTHTDASSLGLVKNNKLIAQDYKIFPRNQFTLATGQSMLNNTFLHVSNVSNPSIFGTTDQVTCLQVGNDTIAYNLTDKLLYNAFKYNAGVWEDYDTNHTELVTAIEYTFGPIGPSEDTVTTNVQDIITQILNTLPEKADLENGKVPQSQLPSYVDEVVELLKLTDIAPACSVGQRYFNTTDNLVYVCEAGTSWVTPGTTPTSNTIYVSLENNKTYRWGGSVMVEINQSLALGIIANSAYDGLAGETNRLGLKAHIENLNNPHEVTAGDVNAYLTTETLNTQEINDLVDVVALDLTEEVDVRTGQYNELTGRIGDEEVAREAADVMLGGRIDDVESNKQDKLTPGENISFDYVGTDLVISSNQAAITDYDKKATVFLTQAEYDALVVKEADRFYVCADTECLYRDGIKIGGEQEIILIKSITYQELKNKRDAGTLVVGSWYRITDYLTTAVSAITPTEIGPGQFDIMVQAMSPTELSEQARAVKHDGDTYFINQQLSAWKLGYCLDNDKDRFEWADESVNGKGVIYLMIDENDNNLAYDFKTIKFGRYNVDYLNPNKYPVWNTTTQFLQGTYVTKGTSVYICMRTHVNNDPDSPDSYWLPIYTNCDKRGWLITNEMQDVQFYYTFSAVNDGVIYDATRLNTTQGGRKILIADNFIERQSEEVIQTLNNNVWITLYSSLINVNDIADINSNKIGLHSMNNTLTGGFTLNAVGSYFQHNVFGWKCQSNVIGSMDDCRIGTHFRGNNTITDFWKNVIKNNFEYNNTGLGFRLNYISNNSANNTFDSGSISNTIGSYFVANTFGPGFSANIIGNSFRNVQGGARISGRNFSTLAYLHTANYTHEMIKTAGNKILISWVAADGTPLTDILT